MPFYKNPLYITLFTVFVDLLGFGILIPILPELLTGKHSTDFISTNANLGDVKYIYYGLLLGIFPLAQFFATPIFGQFSDKFGRKKILTFALAASTFCYALFAVGIMIKSLPLLFLARFLGGVTGGNIAVAQSVISDISLPQDKSKNFGYIGAAFGLGFIIGPFLGAILAGDSALNISIPFWFTTAICLLNTFLVYKFLPETQFPTEKEEERKIDWMQSIHELRQATKLKNLKLILLTSFLFQAGFTFLTTFINPFLSERFAWHIAETGYFFGYIGIWLVISQGFLLRYFLKYGESRVLKYTIIATGITSLALLIPTNPIWLILIAPIFSIFVGFSSANITSLVSHSGAAQKQGEIIGIHSGIQSLAQAIPPILSGFIAYRFSSSAAPIVFSGIIMVASGLIFIIFYKKNNIGLN